MRLRLVGRSIPLPGHPLLRMLLGVALVLGGLLGFLPILGFWMIPVGLGVLATDIPVVRRWYRRMTIRLGSYLHRKWPRFAGHFGYGRPRPGKHV